MEESFFFFLGGGGGGHVHAGISARCDELSSWRSIYIYMYDMYDMYVYIYILPCVFWMQDCLMKQKPVHPSKVAGNLVETKPSIWDVPLILTVLNWDSKTGGGWAL